MAHTQDFLAGLKKAAEACDEQAQSTGGVAYGAMTENFDKLEREAQSVGSINSACAIRQLIENSNDEIATDESITETDFIRGLRMGASLCDKVAEQCQSISNSDFVTPKGKALHKNMAKGAVAAANAVRALIPSNDGLSNTAS